MPINYLLVEALERYHHFYGNTLKVECPTGSGRMLNLKQVAAELASRLAKIFLPDANGRRPCHGNEPRFISDPHWRDYAYFYEYFHGDTGRGVGASHQTGWTSLAVRCIEDMAHARAAATNGAAALHTHDHEHAHESRAPAAPAVARSLDLTPPR